MRTVHAGELYRHFKGKLYQIITVAIHSETDEPLVIYQALYGDFKTYARPLNMFVSEVEHDKYPAVEQKYRFEKIERAELTDEVERKTLCNQSMVSDVATQNIQESAQESSAEMVNPWLLKFLDTDTYEEKLKVLKDMHEHITDRLINDLAVALDVVIPEGDVEERFRHLRICVETQGRFESGRLR